MGETSDVGERLVVIVPELQDCKILRQTRVDQCPVVSAESKGLQQLRQQGSVVAMWSLKDQEAKVGRELHIVQLAIVGELLEVKRKRASVDAARCGPMKILKRVPDITVAIVRDVSFASVDRNGDVLSVSIGFECWFKLFHN